METTKRTGRPVGTVAPKGNIKVDGTLRKNAHTIIKKGDIKLTGEQEDLIKHLEKFLVEINDRTKLKKFREAVTKPPKTTVQKMAVVPWVVSQVEEPVMIFKEFINWADTKDGYFYWDNIDADWIEYCEHKGLV